MNWNGKITGLLIGIFFGPYGIIIGLLLGHLYDKGVFDRFLAGHGYRRNAHTNYQAQQSFFDTTFAVMGYVAKSDGHISNEEINTARQVMAQLGLTGNAKDRAIQFFYSGKRPDFNLDQALQTLKQTCWRHPSLLRTFIEIQIQIANADGNMTAQKRAAIQHICASLGIRGFNFHQYEQQSRARQNYQRHYQSNNQQQGFAGYSTQNQLNDAYKILGVPTTATKEEVKKAYRKLMSQHHPDKLIAKGLPPEMIKLATQKTQQIKKAYETIKSAKGW